MGAGAGSHGAPRFCGISGAPSTSRYPDSQPHGSSAGQLSSGGQRVGFGERLWDTMDLGLGGLRGARCCGTNPASGKGALRSPFYTGTERRRRADGREVLWAFSSGEGTRPTARQRDPLMPRTAGSAPRRSSAGSGWDPAGPGPQHGSEDAASPARRAQRSPRGPGHPEHQHPQGFCGRKAQEAESCPPVTAGALCMPNPKTEAGLSAGR